MRTGSRWVAVLFLTLSFASLIEAQQPAKVVKLGILGSVSDAPFSVARFEAFRQGMRDLGYTEGKNPALEYRTTGGQSERLPELANELVRIKVDVIVLTGGLRPLRAAKNATRTILIVMLGVGAIPVATDIIESLGRPGGNVTGLTTLARKLAGKRLEMFKEAIPRLARVAVLYDPAVRPNVVEAKDVLPVAARTPRLRSIIEKQLARTDALLRATGKIIPWLFHRDGKPIKHFRYSWVTACIQRGVGTRITDSDGKLIKSIAHRIPHDFRRTAVRNLERAGIPRSAAMAMVGHQTMAIYSRYAICDETMLKDAGAKLELLHERDENDKVMAK